MNLINLDIRMLRSLMSVVETGSITETARRPELRAFDPRLS